MLAHAAVQVREAAEVGDALVVAFDAHGGVPAVEGLDEPDDAAETATEDERRGIVSVVAYEAGVLGG